MMNSINGLDGTQELLIKLLEQNPDDWGMRKKVVWFLYEAGYFREASKVVWNAPEIPPLDKEIIFAARIVSKGQPTRAMRLLNAVVERNRAQPEKNLEMAKELVKGGMPLQAARFYGAATLSDSSLIDEDFEVCLITADADEEDWNLIVQSEEFPWDGPLELTEANLACDDEDEQSTEDAMLSGLTQPVPLKAPVQNKAQSMKDTINDEEKALDLRKVKKPLPLNPDKISTKAVTMSILNRVDEDEVVDESAEVSDDIAAEVSESDVEAEDVSAEQEEDSEDVVDIESFEASNDDAVTEADEQSSFNVVDSESLDESSEVSNLDDDEAEEEDFMPEPVAAKKGVFSSLMGFLRRSKNVEVEDSDSDIFAASDPSESEVQSKPMIQSVVKPGFIKPAPITAMSASAITPIAGPVKPKPVPVPSEVKGVGGRKYGQPEALDCRTRLVALAPQDGSAFFNELSQKYAKLPSGKMPEVVVIARDEAEIDYIALVEKACSNDKAINLDSFSQLLGLHAAMTEADCHEWVADMNLLRQGFGDAVLATVVSKYSVSECRDILGAVYRRPATKAAV